jgi:hypothetical protein
VGRILSWACMLMMVFWKGKGRKRRMRDYLTIDRAFGGLS